MTYAGAAPQRVVVVGGGIGGGRTCAALRSAGFDGEIVLIGDELHEPYDRPPLTKAFLHGDVDLDLGLGLAELEVSFARGERATGLDLAQRRGGGAPGGPPPPRQGVGPPARPGPPPPARPPGGPPPPA
ncbi:FAD-dependent oxidoreductase, partial [Streptomyces sp. NPDC091412]|uniref:FAD-dependent oxidoreductase n=1 Tax=Streptomyces sp. NPDC091412 TaxID=3366002 RepID=UPI0038124932